MDLSKVIAHTNEWDLTVVEKKSPTAQWNRDVLFPLVDHFKHLGEEVIYIPEHRDMPSEKEFRQVQLSLQLAELPFRFLEDNGINPNDRFFFQNPGAGAINLAHIMVKLYESGKQTNVIIEDPGKSLHALIKRNIMGSLLAHFHFKRLIVSTWHSEIFEQFPSSVTQI